MSALAFVLALGASAQGEIRPFPEVDPYTKHDPGAIQAAGYVSLGPFRFGDDHTSEQIEQTLGGVPLVWVETAHFKLGSGLPEYTVQAEERERVREELERLAQRLPDVRPRTKKLDPWLRLHLFAQRLEEAYAEFQRRFGVEDADWPATAPDPRAKPRPDFMGDGPYLGMPEKFTVLVFDKKSSLGRYSGRFLGRTLEAPCRWHFPVVGSLLFCTAAEFLEGGYVNDSALTCDVLTGVSQCLASGFRGYRVTLPLFFSEGLAHWFSRRHDARFDFFSGSDPSRIRSKREKDWPPSVRARVENGIFPATEAMIAWDDPDALEWADHLMLWSRVDYLMTRADGAAAKVLFHLKDPAFVEPGSAEFRERARAAILAGTGLELPAFDLAWAEWVRATYPKK